MKRSAVLLLTLLAGCSAQPPLSPRPLPAEATANCIDLKQVAGRRVLPPSAVLFEMVGSISYRADLEGKCAERGDVSAMVETESQSTRLCRDDRVRIYDPVEARATGPASFPMCRVLGFTAVPTR